MKKTLTKILSVAMGFMTMIAVAGFQATAAKEPLGVSLGNCDAAVTGASLDTANKVEGKGSLKATVTDGAINMTLKKSVKTDYKFEDGALVLWIYVDKADTFDKLNVKLNSNGKDGQSITWSLAKYTKYITAGKWNRLVLPYKEMATMIEFDVKAIDTFTLSGSGISGDAKVYVDDIRLFNFSEYLWAYHGIIYYDSFEIQSLLETKLSTDAVSAGYSAILAANNAAAGYHNAEYVYPIEGVIPYPVFRSGETKDFSNASLQNLDLYVNLKLDGNPKTMTEVRFDMTSIAGAYTDIFCFKMEASKLTNKWARYTSSRNKDFSIEQAPLTVDMKKIGSMRWFLLNTDPTNTVLVDNMMLVNSKKYGGFEKVYVLGTANLNGSNLSEVKSTIPSDVTSRTSVSSQTQTSSKQDDSSETEISSADISSTAVSSVDNTSGMDSSAKETDTPKDKTNMGLIIGIVAACIVVLGGGAAAIFIFLKKKKKV